MALPVACTVQEPTLAGPDGVVALTRRTPAPVRVSVPEPGVLAVKAAVPLPRSAFAAPRVNACWARPGA